MGNEPSSHSNQNFQRSNIDSPDSFPTPNSNKSNPFTWNPQPFSQGSDRYAYKGVVNYYSYPYNAHDKIVVKKFIGRHAMSSSDWDLQVKTENKAGELIQAWNKADKINKIYEIVQSTSAKCISENTDSSIKCFNVIKDEYVRIEPYLGENFVKWNSNSGWATDWATSVHAFCHWTYHYTNKKLLFCDAQGAKIGTKYRITDPCIVSSNEEYGFGDGGISLQYAWFSRHRCNDFCESHWLKPTKSQMNIGARIWDVKRGTTYTWDRNAHSTKAIGGKVNKDFDLYG